jgi:hypothetical protein
MNATQTILTTATLLVLAALSACGGGGGGNDPVVTPTPTPPTGGIGRNGVSIGPVANFGSIIVNGVTYNTDSATFMVNDAAATQGDLSVGDVVIVIGTIDDNGTTGTATTVTFDDLVKGPVDSVDPTGNSLVVLGQTVLVSPDTSFDDSFNPASLDGINVGQIVEVSGYIDANDDIIASRLEPKPADTQFEVHGTVDGLDNGSMSFTLRGLTVDYSLATLDDFPNGQIADGDFVEAKGTSLGATGELIATQVELETLVPGVNDGDRVEIEGFITRFVSATDFDVSGLPVTTNGSTVFEGGDAADLGLNIKVEVEGDIDANALVTATKVDIRRAKAVRATANVDSIDAASNSLVVLGFTVAVDALTRLEDKSSADVDPLTLLDINVGDYLEIRGDEFPAGSGNMLATILEREDADTEAILQGFVESISDPSYTVLGVTINTNGSTVFRDESNTVISSADFFNQVTANSLVKAKGTEVSATSITATEVEFEVEF